MNFGGNLRSANFKQNRRIFKAKNVNCPARGCRRCRRGNQVQGRGYGGAASSREDGAGRKTPVNSASTDTVCFEEEEDGSSNENIVIQKVNFDDFLTTLELQITPYITI